MSIQVARYTVNVKTYSVETASAARFYVQPETGICHARLRLLATKPGKKCGLERLPSQDVIAVVRDGEKDAGLAQQGAVVRAAAYGDPNVPKNAFAGVERVLLISSSEVGPRFRPHQDAVEATREQRCSMELRGKVI